MQTLARIALRLVVMALIIGLVAKIVSGIHVNGGFASLLWIAVVFSLVNLVLSPILHLLGLPLIIVTLGLFLLVINAALLGITAALTSDLDIDNFWSAVLGGLLIAIFSAIAEMVLPLREKRDARR
jgi:putative membrane protein